MSNKMSWDLWMKRFLFLFLSLCSISDFFLLIFWFLLQIFHTFFSHDVIATGQNFEWQMFVIPADERGE